MKHSALISLSSGKVTFYDDVKPNENYCIDDETQSYNVMIEFIDPRQISNQQRKFIYAMIYDIAIYCDGYCDELSKTYYKNYFKQVLIENDLLDEYISLSNCSVTEANIMIDFILEFVFRNNIPLRFETIKEYDDLERWQYLCLKYRRCCVCGKEAITHHYDTIGLGNNRRTLDDSQYHKIALCAEHHQQIHNMGDDKFCEKYHVKPIKYEEGVYETNNNDLT